METMKLVLPLNEEMTAIRRHIHQHPELSNEEFETTKLIREKLTEYGIEIAEIGLKTGVLGILRGKKPGKTVAIREDIDALPMPELTELPFASEIPNVCHSCGHDIHTTVLLYCARVLSQIRDELSGTVMFLFQPAEEKGCGAKQFIDCDFTRAAKPDVFIGLHVSPEYDAGTIALKKGPGCASNDFFHIKISGKGGHGAHPENFVDPVMISAYVLTQLQTIVSRNTDPLETVVVGVGKLEAGTQYNIVAEHAVLEGTTRSFLPEVRKFTNDRVVRIAKETAALYGAEAEVEFLDFAAPLVNDAKAVEEVTAVTAEFLPREDIISDFQKALGADDFADYLAVTRGMYAFVGTRSAKDPHTAVAHHHGLFDVDEEGLLISCNVYVDYALWVLNEKPEA